MKLYLRRTAEIMIMAFFSAAGPALMESPRWDRAAFAGAVGAGIAAVYGLLAKRYGDRERPTLQ